MCPARAIAAFLGQTGVGNVWLFGGYGWGRTTGDYGYLNDLWRYDLANNQWTWMGGSYTARQVGVYGTMGVPTAANVPGARASSISWTDGAGNLWLFGGYGWGRTTGDYGDLNDLWRYDPATNQWAWMGGANTRNQRGVYGTKGVSDAANVPGAREISLSWTDGAGNVWLFGGYGYGSTTSSYLNDLWRYELPQCIGDDACAEGYRCVEGVCEPIPDDPPAIGDGPFVAAGNWPLVSSSQENPTNFKKNRTVLWTFSDDFGSCDDDCTHTAEYQVSGDSTWTSLSVSSDAAEGTAQVVLPISSLQNATTYAFRFAVTDCAGQTTQSNTYYFRTPILDAPPVIRVVRVWQQAHGR